MRVGFDARILNSRKRTGIGVYAHSLVRSLASLRPVDRFFLVYPSLHHREMDGWGYEAFPNLSVRGAPVPDGIREDRFYRLWLDFYLPLVMRVLRLDVFHGPANLIPSAGRAKKVLTVHDLSFMIEPGSGLGCSGAFLERFRKSVRAADAIIADSQCTKGDLCRYCGVRAETVKVVHLGVDPSFRVIEEGAARASMRSRLGLPLPYILGPPTLHPRKNGPNLIRAYAMARDRGVEHALVLPGKEYGWGECSRLVEELNIEECVLFPGYVEDEDLVALYNLASVFVYPSLYEGFGLPLLEAMACGCPVIASDRGSIPEVAGDACLSVGAGRVDEIAHALVRLVKDGDLRRSLSVKGLERARGFTWERCARETHEVYEKVLNG